VRGAIVGCCHRGVRWVLFVGVTFVSELPSLCSHGFIVECCHCGHSCVRWVLFVGELPLSESCVRELPLYLYGAIVGLCSLGIARQSAVRKVLFIEELPLSELLQSGLPLFRSCRWVSSWHCVRWVVCQSCSRQGVTFAWSLWEVCLFTLSG
jgi:hypothetical protein